MERVILQIEVDMSKTTSPLVASTRGPTHTERSKEMVTRTYLLTYDNGKEEITETIIGTINEARDRARDIAEEWQKHDYIEEVFPRN